MPGTTRWTWDHLSAPAQDAFIWALLVAALLLGVGTAWFLWRHEDALGERDRREFSIVGACLVAEAPFVKFGWEMNGLLGCLGGWGLGVVVMGPIVLAGAAVVSSRCMRAATWGTTAVGLQMAIVSMCVGAWMYAAGFAGLVAGQWAWDRICAPGGLWDRHVAPSLERWSAAVASALATVYPLGAMVMLRSDPFWGDVSRSVAARFPWHTVDFGMQVSTALLFMLTLTGFALGMSRQHQNAVFAALAPLGTWFVVDRLAVSDWWIEASTWGLAFAVVFAFATLLAGIRERTATA